MPGGGAIARLIVDNYTAKIYSTKAEDVNAVNQLVAQGYSVADAIDKLIEGTGK
jgi:conjugal transfer ATP-binding protein TraC